MIYSLQMYIQDFRNEDPSATMRNFRFLMNEINENPQIYKDIMEKKTIRKISDLITSEDLSRKDLLKSTEITKN